MHGIIGIVIHGYNIGKIKCKGTFSSIRIGSIVGRRQGGEIGYSLENAIEIDSLNSNLGGGNINQKSSDEMRSPDFVTLLNTDNDNPIWVEDKNNINSGYPILNWQAENNW